MKINISILTFFIAFISLLRPLAGYSFPSIYPTGTTIYKPGEVFRGYNLFTSYALNKILLVNMRGDIVHSWDPDVELIGYAEPLSNGHVLAIANSSTYLVELDPDSNVVWSYHHIDKEIHHDFERLGNGNTLILCRDLRKATQISPKPVINDHIIEVDSQGEIVWEWHTIDHFEEFGFSDTAKALIAQRGVDWAHTNSIQMLPSNLLADPRFKEGNILVSQRHTNIIFIIDKDSGQIVWKIGPGDNLTIGQHHAEMIREGFPGEGNIIVFDNGGSAGYPIKARVYSRVIEIEPISKTIVWEYSAINSYQYLYTFFSPFVSGQQRLPNGNTLIDEGEFGRFFEITPEGEIVWEYVNPFFAKKFFGNHYIEFNKCYRVWRVDMDWPPVILE